MKKEFEISILEAKEYISQITDSAHNFIHTKSVVKYSKKILKVYPKINSDLIETATWWHDVGRLYDNNTHEKISAEMAYNSLKKLNLNEDICNSVYDAIIFHKWTMQPQTLEGEIIRDADKLDFISISRWKSCIKNKNFKALNEIVELLPKLRNELLHLETSKQIYDKEIIKFKKFIKNNEEKNFKIIKNKILLFNL